MKSIPRLLRPLAISALVATSAAAQVITFTIPFGDDDTVSFVLNDYAPLDPVGVVDGNNYIWSQTSTSEPFLWTEVSGTIFGGTWTQPATAVDAPNMRLDVDYQEYNTFGLLAGTKYAGDMGLTYEGEVVAEVFFGTVIEWDVDPFTEILPDATAFFSAVPGEYFAGMAGLYIYGEDNVLLAEFSPSTVTISAVPEPSTYAAIVGGLVLVGAAWTRRRANRGGAL